MWRNLASAEGNNKVSLLKGLALSFLGLILFVTLLIFGQLMSMNMTLLNADFMTEHIEELDIAAIINETLEDDDIPQEFKDSLDSSLPAVATFAQTQAIAIINPIYDYVKGDTDGLELEILLKNTLLDPEALGELLDGIDISALAEDILNEDALAAIPTGAEFLADYITQAIIETIDENETWIKEQVKAAITPMVDYLLGDSPTVSYSISLDDIILSLKANTHDALVASPPPEFAGLPPAAIELAFELVWQDFASQFPTEFDFDEALGESEEPVDITQELADVDEAFENSRDAFNYFQMGFILLIVFILLVAGAIILINHKVRDSSRLLGIILLIYGIIGYAGNSISSSALESALPGNTIPSLEIWVKNVMDSVLAPVTIFALVLLIIGTVLLVFSFFYKRSQA